jgi:hypothetical protein
MAGDFKQKFDLSKRRRRYFSEDCGLDLCPECGNTLIADNCTVVIAAKSDIDEGEFISNATGSHFCSSCPVVVFDTEKIEQAVSFGLRGDSNVRYMVAGIVDFKAIPEEKRHIPIGSDDNPVPLVKFLPDLHTVRAENDKTPGRNDPCTCGSGIKYKKCCGQ